MTPEDPKEKKNERKQDAFSELLSQKKRGSTASSSLLEESGDAHELFLLRLRYREGRLIDVGNNAPISLSGSSQVYVVFRGKVDVFCVKQRESTAVSPRKFLFRAEAGEALFGIPARETTEGVELVVVGHPDTQLIRIPQARWESLLKEESFRGEITTLLERWLIQCWGSVLKKLPPKESQRLTVGEHKLTAGQSLRADTMVLWAQASENPVLLLGKYPLLSKQYFPLFGNAWIESQHENSLSLTDTGTYLKTTTTFWKDLEANHTALISLLTHQSLIEQNHVRNRWNATATANAKEQVRASHLLASLLSPTKEDTNEAFEDTPLLFRVCRVVTQAQGVNLTCPPQLAEIPHPQNGVEAIAQYSRVRIRLVTLEGEWWHFDCGSLVGFLEDGTPVALLYERTGYTLLDVRTGERKPLHAETAKGLDTKAFVFYRLLPHHALASKDLIKFALHGRRKEVVTALLAGGMGGFLTLLAPLWIGQLVDSAVPSGNASQLLWITLGLIAAAVAAGWVQLVQSFALLRLEAHADSSLQAAMMDRLLSLPTPFFRHYTTGDLATRVMGINAIRNLLTGTVLQALLGSVFSFLSLTILLRYEMRMALTALMLTAVTVLVMLLLSVIQMRFIRPLLLQQSVLAGFILQFLSGITKIRMTGTESRAFRLWAQVYARQRQTLLQARSVGIALQVFQAGWLPFTSLVLFSTVLFSHNQDFSTGHFLTYNAAFGQFLLGALGLTMALGSLLQAIPYYELARPILETKPEVSEQSLSPGELTGHLRISRVRFRYTPDSPPVLQDVSLSAEPGEFIAIVGSSGAGKSSLLRILMGLDTPESGAVFYDGKDLATLDIQAVRRQMGIVLQNSRLMTGNIFLNIVGTSSLTMEDAWEAARLVGLDRDIKKMPMGMYSVVGEGGGTYSGGQRQRLIIARAIAHRPHLILFDEATSALDNRTQAIITQSLEQLQATRIVVAHRLSTIEKADRIYVLDQGRVVQVGTYQELAKQPGVFADLVKRQTN